MWPNCIISARVGQVGLGRCLAYIRSISAGTSAHLRPLDFGHVHCHLESLSFKYHAMSIGSRCSCLFIFTSLDQHPDPDLMYGLTAVYCRSPKHATCEEEVFALSVQVHPTCRQFRLKLLGLNVVDAYTSMQALTKFSRMQLTHKVDL